MPAINPSLIPTIPAGDLFKALTTQQSLNIRWLVPQDPAYYEVLNRPHADIAVRQLILAKALDELDTSIGHGATFPFLIQPRVATGSAAVDVPLGWIWDISLALPVKWENVRLAKVKRLSGLNPPKGTTSTVPASDYTGTIRLIFTASHPGSTSETALLQADYQIDSPRTYQQQRMTVVGSGEETSVLPETENGTIAGFIIFKTLDMSEYIAQNFIEAIGPNAQGTSGTSGTSGRIAGTTGTTGTYAVPAVYEIVDAVPGDLSGDFSPVVVRHGTGLLSSSAWAAIPPSDSDINGWLDAFNYPFDAGANRRSTGGLVIPSGLFREFDICAPAGDQPAGDISGLFYRVWLSRIEELDATGRQMRFVFSTYNVTDPDNGTPSVTPVDFAILDLADNMLPGDIVEIAPIGNLLLHGGTDESLFGQHFGRGHVVLSDSWDSTTGIVSGFFTALATLIGTGNTVSFTEQSTRVSSFGLSRSPKYGPTLGQWQAMRGSTAKLTPAINPSDSNRFVTEQDQGAGDRVDLESRTGINPHPALDRFGSSGALCHRVIKLIVYGDKTPTGDTTFYATVVLPRLRILLGRDPIFGDEWFDGTRFRRYTGDVWVG